MQPVKKIKVFFSDRTNCIAFILALTGSFMLLPPSFELILWPIPAENYMGNALDASWVIGLNHAKNLGLTWGTDFEFTYGPLFYLSTRFGWGCSKYAFLAYDLFYIANFFAVFFITYKKSSDKRLSAVIIIAAVLLTPAFVGGGNALVWGLLLVFWLRQNMERPHWAFYALQAIILCLLFFMKFNTGLITFILYYASLSYIFLFKKDKRIVVALYALLPVILVVLLAFAFNVSLPGYIISGFNMVSGYNEIMYLEDPVTGEMIALAITFILLLLGILAFLLFGKKELFGIREALYKGLVIIFLAGVSLFVLYKQSFVRADPGHMLDFFKYCTLLLLCINVFQGSGKKKWSIPVVAILMLPVLYAGFTYGQGNFKAFQHKWDKSTYFKEMAAFSPTSGLQIHPNTNQIPQTVKNKIGSSTVDMYPWNAYMLLENKLNYLPRPVMQSYVPYTKYLEDQNFDHYNSNRAPQYVLYAYESLNVDYRYCFFDEPKMHLVLLKNYTQVDAFDLNGVHFLLLEKKKGATPVQMELVKEYAMLTSAPIVPKEGIYYEIELYKTMGGKIESILKYAPKVKLEVRNMDNKPKDYKTAVPMLHTGIFSNRHIENAEDFGHLLKNDAVGKDKQVKYYKIKPLHPDSFKDKIRIREYTIK